MWAFSPQLQGDIEVWGEPAPDQTGVAQGQRERHLRLQNLACKLGLLIAPPPPPQQGALVWAVTPDFLSPPLFKKRKLSSSEQFYFVDSRILRNGWLAYYRDPENLIAHLVDF